MGDRIRGIPLSKDEIDCRHWLHNRLLLHGMEESFAESTMDLFSNIFINREPHWIETLQRAVSTDKVEDDLKKLFQMIIPINVNEQSVRTNIYY